MYRRMNHRYPMFALPGRRCSPGTERRAKSEPPAWRRSGKTRRPHLPLKGSAQTGPWHSPLASSSAGRHKAQLARVKFDFHRRRDISLFSAFKTKIARGVLRGFRHSLDASVGVNRDAEAGLEAGPGSPCGWPQGWLRIRPVLGSKLH